MRFAIAILLAAYVAAEDDAGCKFWKNDQITKKLVCDESTWTCTCDGHPVGTDSPCEGQSAEI